MEELKLVEEAISRCEKLKACFPSLPVLDSIANQLQYLRSVLLGQESDFHRIKEIIIGVQTAREIESLDMETAEIFYKISELVDKMNKN
jgi:hypothetical protein